MERGRGSDTGRGPGSGTGRGRGSGTGRGPGSGTGPSGDLAPLRGSDLAADPVEQFARWFGHARDHDQPEPEAAALATADADGHPSVRFVLLRGFDERGFVFYTNGRSRKGRELAHNPWAAMAFRWATVDRQVRLSGPVSDVSEEQSDTYFAGRPRGSQMNAWASRQSEPASGRDEMDQRAAAMEARFGDGPVPRPEWWHGYRIRPVEVEFWQQGRFRFHDRFVYRRADEAAAWSRHRLYP